MSFAANHTRAEIAPPGLSMRLRLRAATHALHQKLELHLALSSEDWSVQRYCQLLSTMLGIYRPLERSLTSLDWHGSGLSITERCKAPLLEADLAHFAEMASPSECDDIPRLSSITEGIGALYVLEGSTLGGQIILRTLQPQLNISPDAGARFFSSYGKSISEMWRKYLEVLERFGASPQAADTIERSALETFAALDRWLEAQTRFSQNHAVKENV